MFRSNECLSCKYERSQKKVRFEEVIENIKKTKRIDILQPKIRKLEATAESLRLEKKRLHKEIDILNKIRQSKTRILIKKMNMERNELNGTYWTTMTIKRKVSKQETK